MFQEDGRCVCVCLCEIKQWLTATSKAHGVWKTLRCSMKNIRDCKTQDEQTSAIKHHGYGYTLIQGEFKVHQITGRKF